MSTTTLYPVRVTPTPVGALRVPGPHPSEPRPGRPAGWASPAAEARTVVRPTGEVRLTRRGRLVVFLACVAIVLGAAFFLGASSVATQEAGPEAPTEVVVVSTGETLWDLAAERTEPGGDVRDVMLRIERLNALESAALDAGQRLLVPADPAGD